MAVLRTAIHTKINNCSNCACSRIADFLTVKFLVKKNVRFSKMILVFQSALLQEKKKGRKTKQNKTIIDHITGLSVHELVLKEVMALVHAR